MDGVPGLSFHGIRPRESYTYHFEVKQSGTYWYHSHSGFQEQRGVYGPLVIDPREPDPIAFDREHVILLSDWTDEDPERVFRKLKKQSDYYNFHKRTLGDFFKDVRTNGLAHDARRSIGLGRDADESDRPRRRRRRHLHAPDERRHAERQLDGPVQVRRTRAAALHQRLGDDLLRRPHSRIEDDVVAADGQRVHPVTVDEFRIATAETFDVIVEPSGQDAFTIFAQAMDRTAYAAGTLAVRDGLRRAGAGARSARRS